MPSPSSGSRDIDAYIASFPPAVRSRLRQIRAIVQRAAPAAEQAIKYRLPTFVLHGNLVHFGAFKEHIGFYATPSGNAQFRRELAHYPGAKGSVQFPLDQPLPVDLIRRMVEFRVRENLARAARRPHPSPSASPLARRR